MQHISIDIGVSHCYIDEQGQAGSPPLTLTLEVEMAELDKTTDDLIRTLADALAELAYAVSPKANWGDGGARLTDQIDWDFESMETYYQEPMQKARKALKMLERA